MEENKQNELLEQEAKEAYGNEHFGIPKDCTKKQKFNGVKLALYMVLVIFACGLIYTGVHSLTDRYLPEMSFDKSAQPIVYVKGKDLVAKLNQEKKGHALARSTELYEEDGGRVVSIAKKGKMVFFAENRTSENTYDLYCRNLANLQKDAEKTSQNILIAEQVETYKSHPEGKFVFYVKDGSLFFWDKKGAHLISDEVTEYHLSKNGQYVVYYGENGSVYTCAANQEAEPVLVDGDVQKVVSPKDEYNKIYYLKNNALFLKELDEEQQVLLAEQVEDAFLLGEILYYIKKEPYTWAFEEIFIDDRAEYDAAIEEPSIMDLTIGPEEVQENKKQYEEKMLRDSVREYFHEHPVVTERYHLYKVQGDEPILLDSGLAENKVTFLSCRTTVIYKTYLESKEKTRISTIASIEEARAEVARVTEEAAIGLAVLAKDQDPYVGMEECLNGRMEISLDGKYLYCLEDIGEDEKGVLVRYTIAQKALKGRVELCPVASDFTVDGADSSVVIVFDGRRMGICMGKTYTQVAKHRGPNFFYVDKTLYFLDSYSPDAQTGNLMRFRNGKIKQIDSGVHSFDVRNLKTVVYLKNFSRELGFGELYKKEGGRAREKIDICVRKILH